MTEASDLRPKVDHLRDKAVELMGRNLECQQKVEPELTKVNTRWEALISDLRVRNVKPPCMVIADEDSLLADYTVIKCPK